MSSDSASSTEETCDGVVAGSAETSDWFPDTCANFEKSVDDSSDPVVHLLRHRSNFELEGCLESSSLLSEAQFCGPLELVEDPDSFVANVESVFEAWFSVSSDRCF